MPPATGSYHMIHRIDGEIAIVGVLDYLDTALSSVYLFYDPKWEFLSPGTLAALREIEYMKKVRHLAQDPEGFRWYAMGLYYQDCQKSVYKANFKPAMVACPKTWNFVLLTEEVKKKINDAKWPQLSDQPPAYEVDKRVALEKGLRSELKLATGQTLNFMNLNPAGQKLLKDVLPALFAHMGLDVADNCELIV